MGGHCCLAGLGVMLYGQLCTDHGWHGLSWVLKEQCLVSVHSWIILTKLVSTSPESKSVVLLNFVESGNGWIYSDIYSLVIISSTERGQAVKKLLLGSFAPGLMSWVCACVCVCMYVCTYLLELLPFIIVLANILKKVKKLNRLS